LVACEKWSINQGFLRNFSEYLKLFNIELCKEFTFSKKEVDEQETVGIYIIKNGDIVAIYSYSGEIHLVLQNKIYNLSNSIYTMEVENLNDEARVFRLRNNEGVIKEVVYQREKHVDFDPWNNEDDVDFFAWLAKMYTTGRLEMLYNN
jgi:hypothetical protein